MYVYHKTVQKKWDNCIIKYSIQFPITWKEITSSDVHPAVWSQPKN